MNINSIDSTLYNTEQLTGTATQFHDATFAHYLLLATMNNTVPEKQDHIERKDSKKKIDPAYQRLSQKCLNYHLSMGVKHLPEDNCGVGMSVTNQSNEAPSLQSGAQNERHSSYNASLCNGNNMAYSPLYSNRYS